MRPLALILFLCLPACYIFSQDIGSSRQPIDGVTGLNVKRTERVSPGYQTTTPANKPRIFMNEIPLKAVREFIYEFKDDKNVTWQKANDGGYAADFTSDSIKTMVAYNRRGSRVFSLKKYGENKMPPDMRRMVKRTFIHHVIMEVTEIKPTRDSANIIYCVLIKNTDNFKILRICNNEMEITSDYYTKL